MKVNRDARDAFPLLPLMELPAVAAEESGLRRPQIPVRDCLSALADAVSQSGENSFLFQG